MTEGTPTDALPLRLLRVVHSMNPRGGGVAEAIRQFGLAAQDESCALTVLCLDPPEADFLQALPFPVVALGPCQNRYGYCQSLRPWLNENLGAYDLVVIDGMWMYHGRATHLACRKQKRPYCVMTHGMLDPWFKRQYPLKHLKKSLYWWAIEYRILRDAAKVIFTAEEESFKARQSFRPYSVRDANVPLGIQTPSFDADTAIKTFRVAFPNLENGPYLLFMGRLNKKKGVDRLIQAYRQLEASRTDAVPQLVIAGPEQDAAFTQQLYQLADGCERIHFTGMLQGSIKWGALAGAQAMVLPSHQENFGVVVAEALAVGTPVLLSKNVDIWREICQAGAGWAEANDVEGIQAMILSLLGQSADESARMRRSAKQCFERNFEAGQSARKFIELFESLSVQRRN